MMGIDSFKKYLFNPISIAPLVFFRCAFGLLMFVSLVRFISKGWIQELYIKPNFHFSYYGFEWLPRFDAFGIKIVFALSLISTIGICLGLLYRWSASLFFLTFTYIELLDKANYLNHYYFISLVALVMIFLPAAKAFSLDVKVRKKPSFGKIPTWSVRILQLLIGGLYFMAGVAKLNGVWLLEAMPMKIWLPPHSDMPIIGPLMDETWVAYIFSWLGALYDLLIPFLLLNKRSRPFAFLSVVIFHGLTAIFFPIGMFPYVMIVSSFVFFSPKLLERIVTLNHRFILTKSDWNDRIYVFRAWVNKILMPLSVGLLFLLFVFPLRSYAYEGNSYWHEQGYRFSWRVMLMEKAGHSYFYVKDPLQKGERQIDNLKFLTPNQEKQMCTQPDMILQFAHYLGNHFEKQGIINPEVRVESWVSLNGSGSRLFIDPSVNLMDKQDSWDNKDWVIPYDSVITLADYKRKNFQL